MAALVKEHFSLCFTLFFHLTTQTPIKHISKNKCNIFSTGRNPGRDAESSAEAASLQNGHPGGGAIILLCI